MRVLGVRHHSPACAALAVSVIAEVRPAWVLIEGPADFNDRLDELLLDHQLPIAIFSYRANAAEVAIPEGGNVESRSYGCHAYWTPFCDYSPEWVALQAGHRVGARVRFIDLPGWSVALEDRENRYRERSTPNFTRIPAELGFDDNDRLWDSLFEQPRPDLEMALDRYFEELRTTLGEVSAQDRVREQFMARSMAWAQAQGGEVVVICGGYHAPFLKTAWRNADPSEPRVAAQGAGVGNFLVPFTFQRLDSYAGYGSGMPSPGYHQRVWEGGLAAAARQSLQDVAVRLRGKGQAASSADLVVAHAMTEGLARLRGHSQPSRTDVLDGLASALLKEALEVDLPWSQRGSLSAGSDPILVEIVAAFSGERRGQLAPSTPRPPLLCDVSQTLRRLELQPATPARRLQLHIMEDRERSACLHRLRLLGIPGFQRLAGPAQAGLEEEWSLSDLLERESALIEASQYGPDLHSACSLFLEEALTGTEGAAPLASLLSAALLADLGALSKRALLSIPEAVRRESSVAALGPALGTILEMFAYDTLLGGQGKVELRHALETGFGRGLWLLEGLQAEEPGSLLAVRALRDLHRHPQLELRRELAQHTMRRIAREEGRAAALQGAAAGYLWSLEEAGDRGRAETLHRFHLLPPAKAADFLVGLLALAREKVLEDPELVRCLDAQIRAWSGEEFLQALPALRLAFTALPPHDKERLGELLANLYGQTVTSQWLRLEVPAEVVARGHDLEERLDAELREIGLA